MCASSSNPAIYHYIRSNTKSGTYSLPQYYLSQQWWVQRYTIYPILSLCLYFIFPRTWLCNIPPHLNQLDSLVFSEDEVYNALTQSDPNKATGIDKIIPKIIKYCAGLLFHPVCHLFNLMQFINWYYEYFLNGKFIYW